MDAHRVRLSAVRARVQLVMSVPYSTPDDSALTSPMLSSHHVPRVRRHHSGRKRCNIYELIHVPYMHGIAPPPAAGDGRP
eukprot:scaffold15060_cov131-Isochrysis_galbana.AAC.4